MSKVTQRAMSRRSLRALLSLLALLWSSAWAQEVGVLLASDGEFIKIDLTEMAVTGKGTLGRIGYVQVFNVHADPLQIEMLVQASKTRTKAGPVAPDILVLDNNAQLVGKISGAREDGALSTAAMSDTKVFVSLYDSDAKRRSLLVFDRGSYKKPIDRIDGFSLNEYSTILDTKIYKPMASSRRDIFELDLRNKTIKQSSYEAVGSTEFAFKIVRATSGSIALILERKTRRDEQYALYVYDMDKKKVLKEIDVSAYRRSDFHILEKRKLILADEKAYVPHVLADGTVSGHRYKHVGRLRVVGLDTGAEVAFVKVPEEGKVLAISADEKVAYYFSLKTLTAIDLETYRVRKTVDLPFPSAPMMALLQR